ncbi:MAG: hypothetical protein ACP6IS_12245 [Candidatus Asgardarchaeia archaeon]
MKRFLCFLLFVFIFSSLQLSGQDTSTSKKKRIWCSDVNEYYTLKFELTYGPREVIIDDPVKGPVVYTFFNYTITNDTGVVVPPELIKEGEVLARDVYDIKGVRIFKGGRKLSAADIRILRRVTLRPIFVDGKRKPAGFFKVGDTLPQDVKDFDNNIVFKQGTVLDERALSILNRIPLGPIYIRRPVQPYLDIRIFVNKEKTMKCIYGCGEEYDISHAYPGVRFTCGAPAEILKKLGIKRITQHSIYTGEDGVYGCGRELTVIGKEYPEIINETVEKKVWNTEDKICQYCGTRFGVNAIKRFRRAKIKCPLCHKFFEDDFSRYRLTDKIICPECGGTFLGKDVEEVQEYQIECPACGQWLTKDKNFVEVSEPGVFGKRIRKIKFGETVRGIAVFKRIDLTMSKMTILIAGLTNRYYLQMGSSYIPLTGKLLKKAKYDDVRVKVLALYYQRRGDEFRPDLDYLDFRGRNWIYLSLPVKVNLSNMEFSKLKQTKEINKD